LNFAAVVIVVFINFLFDFVKPLLCFYYVQT
jgi:hypothetical protein